MKHPDEILHEASKGRLYGYGLLFRRSLPEEVAWYLDNGSNDFVKRGLVKKPNSSFFREKALAEYRKNNSNINPSKQ